MIPTPPVTKAIFKSAVYTILTGIVFWIVMRAKHEVSHLLLALPFFLVFYFMLFTIGKPEVAGLLRNRIKRNVEIGFLFPLALGILYFIYVGIHGQNPFQGTLFLVPFLLLFPVLAMMGMKESGSKITWLDFTVFFLFFFPVTLVNVQPAGELPFQGGGFDSVYRISVMLAAVFAFAVIRNIKDVGFYPVFSLSKLWTVLWVWAVFYGSVIVIAYPIDFIRFKGGSDVNVFIPMNTARKFMTILLHTALFEELVFRGLLQRMLSQRIAEGGNWKIFIKWGSCVLVLISLVIGFSMKDSMPWFPAVIIITLCAAAYGLETKQWQAPGTYTALAISSAIFGLVHAHSGSVIFVGLAAIGGWAYGFAYLKTNNVFYAALLHALVNSTPMFFGLELAK